MDKFFEIEGIMFKDGGDNGSQPTPTSGVPIFVPTIEGTITDPDQDRPVVTNIAELNALGDIAIFSPSENDMTASWSFDNYSSSTGAFIIKKNRRVVWRAVSSGGFYDINARNGEIYIHKQN